MNKFKKFSFSLLFAAMAIAPQGAMSQVTIGADTEPQNFSVLELISNSKGLRLPQLTQNQRDALVLAGNDDAKGLTIFNLTTRCVEYWNGSIWIQSCGPDGPAPSTYTVTATVNNSGLGSANLSGSAITATPYLCTDYAAPAYTISPAGATTLVSQVGNVFTFSQPTADCTVTINFAEIPAKAVTLDAQGGSLSGNAVLTQTNCTTPVVLPTPDSPCDWEFAGWVDAPVTTVTTTAPALIPVGNYLPEGDITLYAVYEKVVETSSYDYINKGLSDLENGTYLLSIYDELRNYTDNIFTGVINGSGHGLSVVPGNKMSYPTLPTGAAELTFTSAGAANIYYIQIGTDFLGTSGTSSGNLTLGTTNTDYWTFTVDDIHSDEYRMKYNGNNAYLAGFVAPTSPYTVTFRTNSASTVNRSICLFKKVILSTATYSSNPPVPCD